MKLKKIKKKQEKHLDEEQGMIGIEYYAVVLSIFVMLLLLFGKPEKNKAQISDKKSLYKLRNKLERKIEKENPKILFLGNSIIRDGFSDSLFKTLSNVNFIRVSPGGSGTAFWYLYLKNVFFYFENNPVDLIVITFRDRRLTSPKAGTAGGAVYDIYKVSTDNEPLYERLVLHNNMDMVSYWFYNNFAILQKRSLIRKRLEERNKYLIGKILSFPENKNIDSLIKEYFKIDNLNIKMMTKIELSGKENKNNFNYMINKSFLPYIIDLAKKKNKQLIFVRYKRRRDLIPNSEPENIKIYMQDLKKYLTNNNLKLIDMTNDPRIKEEHFKNGDHLNEKGRLVFTRILYEELKKNCTNFPEN